MGMGKSIGALSLDLELSSSSLSDQLKQKWLEAQTYADEHTIKYSFTGDKSQLESIMKQIQKMNPEVHTGFVIDFNDKEYKKQLEFLQTNTDKKAKDIGENFKKYIGKSFSDLKFDAKNIENVKDLKQVARELKANTKDFKIEGANFKDVENYIMSLKKLEAVLKELESRGQSSFTSGTSGNVTEALSATSGKIAETIKSFTPIIEQNAKAWASTLEQTFETEFGNILQWVKQMQDAINNVFHGNASNPGKNNPSEAFNDLQKQIDETINKIKEAETELENLNKLKDEGFAAKSQRERKQTEKNQEIYQFYGDNKSILANIEEDPSLITKHSDKIEKFKTLVGEYISLGGELKNLKAFKAIEPAKILGFEDKDFSKAGIAKQIENITAKLNGLKQIREDLIAQQTQLANSNPDTDKPDNGKNRSATDEGTPTNAEVHPKLSSDFKKELQNLVTAEGAVDVSVAPILEETFKENAQQQVKDLGSVDMGVHFTQDKKEGESAQEIPVDVVATPKLSDTFKADLQAEVDKLGSYEVTVDLKDKTGQSDTDTPTLIKVKPENAEEFKAELKSGIEGENGLDIKVNPVVPDDFKLEIKNATIKDVKIEGDLTGGNLKPATVETPTASSGDDTGQGDVPAKLEETKEKYEEIGKAAVESGKEQKQSLFEVIKEIERITAEQKKLMDLEDQPVVTSENKAMTAFIEEKKAAAAKYQSAQELDAKIQKKNKQKLTGNQSDYVKHWAGIVAYVERFKELAGDAFSYDILGENGEEKFNNMKKAVDEATKSVVRTSEAADENNRKIREFNDKLTELRQTKNELEATASGVEKLEAELYDAAKAAETLAPKGKNTITINTDSKKFTDFFEKWKEYKDGGGTRNITEFTNEAKVINTVNREYSNYLEAKKAARAEATRQAVAAEKLEKRIIAQNRKDVEAGKEALKTEYPDIDLEKYTKLFDQMINRQMRIKEGFERIREEQEALKQASILETPQETPEGKPLNPNVPGEINVVPKVENPAEFAKQVTEQLKGVAADINIILDKTTLDNLATLDAELNKIIEKLQNLSDKTLKVNVDCSSVEQLSKPNKNGANVIDSLKKSIDGLQTGVLKELGTALSSLNVKNDLDVKIINLAIALGELKEILNNVSPDSNNFLATLKELSNQASGLKDLATVIKASKEEIDKAKNEMNGTAKSDKKNSTATDKEKYVILKDQLKEILRLTKEYNSTRNEDTKNDISLRIKELQDEADTLQLELWDLEKINEVEQNRIDILHKQISLAKKKKENSDAETLLKSEEAASSFMQQLSQQNTILKQDSEEWQHALELLYLYKDELKDVVKIERNVNVDDKTGFKAISYKFTDSVGNSKVVGADADLLIDNTKIADLNVLYQKLKTSATEYYTLQSKIIKGDTSDKTQRDSLFAYNNMVEAQKEIAYWKQQGLIPSKEQLQIEERLAHISTDLKAQEEKSGLSNMYHTVLNTISRLNDKQKELQKLKIDSNGTDKFAESIKNAQENISLLIGQLRGFKFDDFFTQDALSSLDLNGESLLFDNDDLNSLKWVISQLPLTEEQVQKLNDALDKNTLIKEQNVAAQEKINDTERAEKSKQAQENLQMIESSLKRQFELTKQIVSLDKNGQAEESKVVNDQLVEEIRNCKALIAGYRTFSDVVADVDANLDKAFGDSKSRFTQFNAANTDAIIKGQLEDVQKQLAKEAADSSAQQKSKWESFVKEQADYENLTKINSAISETDKLLDGLQLHERLDKDFLELLDFVDKLNSELRSGQISVSNYEKSIKKLASGYSERVNIQQNRDKEEYDMRAADKAARVKQANSNLEAINKSLETQYNLTKQIAELDKKGRTEEANQRSEQLITEALNCQKLIDTYKTFSDVVKDIDANLDKAFDDNASRFATLTARKSDDAKLANAGRVSDVNVAFDEATQINNALNNTANLMKQFENSDIQGFDKIFERAKNQVDELNKKLTHGDIENVQKGYSDKVNKIVSDMRSIQTVIQPGNIQYAQEFMKQYAQSLNNGAVKLGNFINHGKTLNVTLEEQGGILHNIALEYNEVTGAISLIEKGSKKAIGSLGEFLDGLKHRFASLAQYLLTFVSFYRVWAMVKNGVQVIRELDTALTEMRKVSDEAVSSLKNFQKVSFDIAKTVGSTAQQIQASTADWMRLGEVLNDAARSAEVTNILFNVSEFETIDEATESLVAMSQAYKDLDKMDIVNKLNEVGNNYAISTDQIAVALQRSASSLTTAGNNMDEAIALITAGNAIVQDAESVGAGMRTIALRLTGTKEASDELEELGEDTEGVITTVSKLRDTIKSATSVASNGFEGFDILDDNGNYKSTYEIMKGISEVYDEIVETDKKNGTNNINLLLETIAGKNRSNIAASILQNNKLLESVYDSSANKSAGSAEQELEKYLDSIEGKIAQFQNQVQEFWYNIISSDTVKGVISIGTGLLEFVNKLTGTFREFSVVIAGVGIGLTSMFIKSKKNGGGRIKMFILVICHRIVQPRGVRVLVCIGMITYVFYMN